MPGPPPKPANQRVRRVEPEQRYVALGESYDGPMPELPQGIRWTKATRQWWERIWRTPMASQWLEGDYDALVELAFLRQKMLGGILGVASQVRQREDSFGLSPRGRQILRWVATDEDAERAGMDLPDELEKRRERRQALRDKREASE